jgi:hypothetical protein
MCRCSWFKIYGCEFPTPSKVSKPVVINEAVVSRLTSYGIKREDVIDCVKNGVKDSTIYSLYQLAFEKHRKEKIDGFRAFAKMAVGRMAQQMAQRKEMECIQNLEAQQMQHHHRIYQQQVHDNHHHQLHHQHNVHMNNFHMETRNDSEDVDYYPFHRPHHPDQPHHHHHHHYTFPPQELYEISHQYPMSYVRAQHQLSDTPNHVSHHPDEHHTYSNQTPYPPNNNLLQQMDVWNQQAEWERYHFQQQQQQQQQHINQHHAQK